MASTRPTSSRASTGGSSDRLLEVPDVGREIVHNVTRNRYRTPVMMRLRLQMLAPLSIRCSWKSRTSSAVAVSGERFNYAANRLQLEMWLRCVCRLSMRAANQANGMLTPTGQVIKTSSPCTIVFARV